MSARNTAAHRGRHARGAMPSYGSRTDVGLVRDHNEDSLVVSPPLFAVADGMGGHAAGEVASEVAVQVLSQHTPSVADGDDLARAVVAANRAVIRAAREGLGREGMGTTMTAAMLDGNKLVVAQVGDSRAYLLHRGALQRITRDHSLMADYIESGKITEEEAKTHPQRSVITRALGSDPNTLPDIYEMNVAPGDKLLLCSDGLSGMVDDPLLESTLARIDDPQRCADILVDQAISAGGVDNITAVVVNVEGGAAAAVAKEERRGKLGVIAIIVMLALILIGGAIGINAYLNTAAFLTEDNGEVVICRGVPAEVLGIKLWELDQRTGVDVDNLQLPPNTKSRLTEETIQTDSVEDAEELLQTWQNQVSSPTPDPKSSDKANDEKTEDSSSDSAAPTKSEGGEN